MDIINIKNGILLDYTREYSLYEMYTNDTDKYYMAIANNNSNNFEMVIDFPETYFNSLLDENKIEEIKNTCDNLFSNNHSYVYILTDISTHDIDEAMDDNDDRGYQILLRKLQKYTYNVYKSLTNNSDNITIGQTINIIVDTDNDKKLINWLDLNLNNYFKPLYLNKKNDNKEITDNVNILDKDTDVEIKLQSKPKVKKIIPDNRGFSSISIMNFIIFIALILGLGLAYLLIR